MKLGSLCTGYGGLDLAVEALLPTQTVWLSEIDKNAAKVCEARFPGVPNLGDLTAIDWSEVEPVDVLTAGYPCQPFSQAGRRQGTNDARHIWPFILDALRVLRPRLACFENVRGHLSLGFDRVLADLASIGFDAEWALVRASDLGLCHHRSRLFLVASDANRVDDRAAHRGDMVGAAGAQRRARGAGVLPRHGGGHHEVEGDDDRRGQTTDAADADGGRRIEPHEGQRGLPVTDADVSPVHWGEHAGAVEQHARVIGRPAPAPTAADGRLNPAFVEWMMCLPAGWVTDVLPRNPALKALGNGVVPPQAAYAISHLLERHEAAERAA